MPGQLSGDIASHDFGIVEVGVSSAAITWTITNTGAVATGCRRCPAAVVVERQRARVQREPWALLCGAVEIRSQVFRTACL
jgi:hypothetical protein